MKWLHAQVRQETCNGLTTKSEMTVRNVVRMSGNPKLELSASYLGMLVAGYIKERRIGRAQDLLFNSRVSLGIAPDIGAFNMIAQAWVRNNNLRRAEEVGALHGCLVVWLHGCLVTLLPGCLSRGCVTWCDIDASEVV